MISRITLNLRMTVYGPPRLTEKTRNNIPLAEFKEVSSARPRRSRHSPYSPTTTTIPDCDPGDDHESEQNLPLTAAVLSVGKTGFEGGEAV